VIDGRPEVTSHRYVTRVRRALPVRAVAAEDKKLACTHVQYLMKAERTPDDELRRIEVLATFCRTATTHVGDGALIWGHGICRKV